jgi:hypothetical protein
MSTNEPGNQDEALGKLLQEWRADAPLPPHFQQAVWRRIEGAQAPPRRPFGLLSRLDWHGAAAAGLAASYVAILLALGVTAGWTQARQETARVKGELGERYIRVLDPYQIRASNPMKKGVFILVLGLALAAAAYGCIYFVCTSSARNLEQSSQAGTGMAQGRIQLERFGVPACLPASRGLPSAVRGNVPAG